MAFFSGNRLLDDDDDVDEKGWNQEVSYGDRNRLHLT